MCNDCAKIPLQYLLKTSAVFSRLEKIKTKNGINIAVKSTVDENVLFCKRPY